MKALTPFLKLFKTQFKWMFVGTLLAFMAILASIGLMSLSGWFISATGFVAISSVFIGHQFNYFYPAGGVRSFSLLRIVTRYGERLFTHEATFKILTQVRVWIYTCLAPLAPTHLVRYKSGDLLTRFVDDVNAMDNLYIRIISPCIVLVLSIITIGVFFSFLSIKIAIITMICATIAGFIIPLLTGRLAKHTATNLTHNNALLKSSITEHTLSLAELKIFGAEQAHTQMIAQQSEQLISTQKRMSIFSGLGSFLMTIMLGVTLWLGVWFAVGLVHQGVLNGAFIALIALGIMALYEAIMPLPVAYQYLGKTVSAAKRITQLTNQQPTIEFTQNAAVLDKENSTISFKDISFGYDDRRVFKHFSLQINAREKLAITGPTGCGKSTLINLLCRFWDPQSGSIQLAGTDIKTLSENQLRQSMTVISQHAHIFNGTIADNLKIANASATQEQLWQALQAVDLKDFVSELPKQLETWTGEHGKHLSKGQQKRLSLARAFLSTAAILVLDEPTEGLDRVTEEKVFTQLLKVMDNKTVIMITHNQKLLSKMDRSVQL